jgi:hypothetical protein
MLRTLLRGAVLAGALVATQALPVLAAAPRQLYNKTIQINWTTGVAQTGPDGQTRNVSVAVSRTVYVSTAGRIFERASRSTRRGSKTSENAPGTTRNAGGEATALHFEGNRLVGNLAFAQGGRRFVATFDPGFSSCTVAVQYGREAGGIKRKGVDGVMYTIHSMTTSGESCSIREGNPFGN